MKKVLAITALVLCLGMGSAFAITPADINGTDGGEWATGQIIDAWDPNEGGTPNLPDDYDFEHIVMIQKSEGGANDGLYILLDLYGTPTWTSLDESAPFDPVFYTTSIDVNADGDFSDSVDRSFDFRQAGFTVYDGTGAVIAGSPTAIMGSVVEYYIPSGMFSGYPMSEFRTFSLLDNAGAPQDDRTPNEGYLTSIPEPASMLLLGMGILGLVGLRGRKKA